MKLDDLYRDVIAKHYRLRSGHGLQEEFTAEVHKVNPSCGDEITLRLRHHAGAVDELSHETVGCTLSQASASVMHTMVMEARTTDRLTELHDVVRDFLRGANPEPPESVGAMSAFGAVRFSASRVRCALLPWQALTAALRQVGPPAS
ncbi:SUF system NifU family Fe-S cluster assembly protein [Crossiella sp. CA-258035]|uniref:Fe-S cluster assembly sulfur transfer protein SufU n=1 Tax=Crossiella sp. CA-258035 TaxID=2981138 RepID=UPI0024BCE6B9|nr:SUF system NifU family Fe-S cluster assembly protein [Crossiella sp. CA-258035]WHT22945.1 SUF system NifU family Fe-S cluster assembly protein [Crossiella sp. CA-258035]